MLKSSTARIQKRTKASIIQNRHDNEQLIGDLEVVRRRKKDLEAQKELLDLRIGELRLEKQSREREFEKKLHEIHKRVNAQEAAKEIKPDEDDKEYAAAG